MLDTIVLLIPQEKFKILDYEAFTPSAKGLFEPPFYKLEKGYMCCVQNPNKADFEELIYKPRLTLIKNIINGGYSVNLKIEFSAPKLLFGNNFQELEDKDFSKVAKKLRQKLKEMQIDISAKNLKNAQVKGIHYSKNIVLNAPSSLVINTLGKLNISKRLDTGNTDYRNEGQAIRYHANSYEFVFYDKMQDLEQYKISEKRAIEKDNYAQYNLFTTKEIIKNEVLRMEVRLNSKRKIKEMLEKVELAIPVTFQNLFKKEISQKILLHFWDNSIAPSLSLILLSEETAYETFYRLKNMGLKENKILQILGALQIIKESGLRNLKTIIEPHNFYRLQNELKKLDNNENYLYSIFKLIRADLHEMHSLQPKEIKIKALK